MFDIIPDSKKLVTDTLLVITSAGTIASSAISAIAKLVSTPMEMPSNLLQGYASVPPNSTTTNTPNIQSTSTASTTLVTQTPTAVNVQSTTSSTSQSIGGAPKSVSEVTKLVKITIPKFTLFDPMPTFPSIFSNIKWPSFTIGLDGCHLDLGIFGSLLKAMMLAVKMIISAVINGIINALNEAIQKFLNLIPIIMEIKEWFKNLKDNACKQFKKFWNTIKKSKNDISTNELLSEAEQEINKLQRTLWQRVCDWFEGLWNKKIWPILKLIGKLVTDLCDLLITARDLLWSDFVTVIIDLGKIPGDICCLIKASTFAIAFI